MRSYLIIFILILSNVDLYSQSITNTIIQQTDCNNSIGYINVQTDIPASWFIFKQDTGMNNYITIQTGPSDTVYFTGCGNISVDILNSSFVISDADTFFVPCKLGINPSFHNNVACNGDSTGSLQGIAFGGFPPYYYEWYTNGILYSSGSYDTIITGLPVGQYTLIVSDSNGCSDSVVSNISQPDEIYLDSIFVNPVKCKYTNTASVYLNIKGGKRFGLVYYDVLLLDSISDTIRYINRYDTSNNIYIDTTPFYIYIDSLYAGDYSLLVLDSFGCKYDLSIYVSDPDDYELHVSNSPSIVCEADSTWLFIDSISGGYPNLDFIWINSLTDSIYVRSGIHQVEILDTLYGCLDTIDFSLIAPNTIFSNVSSSPAFCYGTNTGSLQIDTIYGGISPYFVQWGGINIDSLYAGNYTLFITDSIGCVYMEDYTVEENLNVSLNEVVYFPLCNGDSNGVITIRPEGGVGNIYYNWIDFGSTDSIYNLSTGTYFINLSDSLGCNFYDSVYLNDPELLTVNLIADQNPLVCNGGQTLISANISGGTGTYNINWINNSQVFSNSQQVIAVASNYSIEVFDENGCFIENQINISEPTSLSINVSVSPSVCNLGSSAEVIVSGGTFPMYYIWSNGDTSSNSSGFLEGNHWVLVTDSCGDTAMHNFTVNEYVLQTSIYFTNNPLNYAEIEVDNSTAGPPFTYQWYDENMDPIVGENNSVLNNLCPTWYYVITNDENNCQVKDSVLAEIYLPLGNIVDISTTTVYDDSNLWGAEPYTYLWDNGDVTPHAEICPGIHRVWVTDSYGCELYEDIFIEDIILSLDPSDIIIECDISNLDVELEVNASGGTGQFSFLWNSGDTINPINTSINPGKYTVAVTDDNNCSVDTSFYIASMTSQCIPNIFTPNFDNINDFWTLEDAFFYDDSEVSVYNRYGKLVFQSYGYRDPWDGTNISGNEVEEGTYFYVIDLGGGIDKIKGSVMIIR